jgi:hypothetical protein
MVAYGNVSHETVLSHSEHRQTGIEVVLGFNRHPAVLPDKSAAHDRPRVEHVRNDTPRQRGIHRQVS